MLYRILIQQHSISWLVECLYEPTWNLFDAWTDGLVQSGGRQSHSYFTGLDPQYLHNSSLELRRITFLHIQRMSKWSLARRELQKKWRYWVHPLTRRCLVTLSGSRTHVTKEVSPAYWWFRLWRTNPSVESSTVEGKDAFEVNISAINSWSCVLPW